MRFGKLLSTLILTACCSLSAAAWQGTRTWQQSTFDDFSEGTAKGVAIRSRGVLELSPQFKQLHTSASTFVWSIASDEAGNVYLATGSPARVYRVTPEGKATVIFAPKELQVQAIALDRKDPKVIYAATSPDGMLYKIEKGKAPAPAAKPAEATAGMAASEPVVDPAYTSSVVFDPKTKYIWSLALREGEIYMATGDRGEIFKVTSTGQNSVFFKSDEAHIRTLAFSPQGELYAGTDGSGLIYRISKSGEGFVVYSAPKKEITALMVDEKGKVYAAGAGEKTVSVRATTALPMNISPGIPPNPQMGAQPIPMPTPNPGFGLSFASSSGSEIYVISPEGAPRRLWTSKEDLVYALHRDSQGRLLAGTGNKGRVIAIEDNGDFTDLVKASASQVTGFAAALKGGTYAASSNLGKVFQLSAASEAEGTYESDVFDARIFSRWGRAEVRGEGDFELFSRSGNVDNPDRNWSAWKKIDLKKDAMVEAPPARFVQWKAVFPPSGERPARITAVKIYYRPNNIAPAIEDVNVQAGARIPTTPMQRGGSEMVMMGNSSTGGGSGLGSNPRFDPPVAAQRDKGSIAVRWTVRDENDDALQFALYYRGDHETNWKLLKEKITDRHYSWDAGLLPDGGYTVRVVATDAPSHTPDEALSDARESKRFEVDNGPPRIDALTAKVAEGRIHISFSARDTFSPIERAEFSINAGEWQFIEPVGQLSDSLTESYDFSTALPAGEILTEEELSKSKDGIISREHTVIVRVYDSYDNMSTAKVVLLHERVRVP